LDIFKEIAVTACLYVLAVTEMKSSVTRLKELIDMTTFVCNGCGRESTEMSYNGDYCPHCGSYDVKEGKWTYGVDERYVRVWTKKIAELDSGKTIHMEGDMLEDFKRNIYNEDIHSIYDTSGGQGKWIKLKSCINLRWELEKNGL
jgi:predicted Zn-ribbon and HTH transcriptional regulator